MSPDSTLEAVLMIIVKKYPEYLQNEHRLLSLFSDLAPQMVRERKILHAFFSCGGMDQLYPLSSENCLAEHLNQRAQSLIHDMFRQECIDRQSATDFVNTWLSVVSVKPAEKNASNPI